MSTRILIIDDDNDFRELISYTFKTAGYEIITADNGKTGLETAQKEMPDAIITDLMLPQLNGYEICTMIKQDIRYQKIPVIILSATRMEEKHAQLAEECGCDAYIFKTATPQNILEQVKQILSKVSQPN